MLCGPTVDMPRRSAQPERLPRWHDDAATSCPAGPGWAAKGWSPRPVICGRFVWPGNGGDRRRIRMGVPHPARDGGGSRGRAAVVEQSLAETQTTGVRIQLAAIVQTLAYRDRPPQETNKSTRPPHDRQSCPPTYGGSEPNRGCRLRRRLYKRTTPSKGSTTLTAHRGLDTTAAPIPRPR